AGPWDGRNRQRRCIPQSAGRAPARNDSADRNQLARRRSRRRAAAEDSRPHLYARAAVADAGRHAALYFWQSSFPRAAIECGKRSWRRSNCGCLNFRVSGGNLWRLFRRRRRNCESGHAHRDRHDGYSLNECAQSVLGSAINGIAVLVFIMRRAIFWPHAAIMVLGAIVGGYFGAHYALRLPQAWVRWFVIFVGAGMTAYFFAKAY